MPDWFYRTATRPVLFRVPAERARDFALGFMGRLARTPFGPAAIDFLGHMRADPRLGQSFLGLHFPTALGLGPGLDAKATALPALARFGFGFLEVGPVTVAGSAGDRPVARQVDQEAIWNPDPPFSLSLACALPRIAEAARTDLPVIVRLAATSGAGAEQAAEELKRMIRELAPQAHLFALPLGTDVDSILEAASSATPPRPVLLCLPADLDLETAEPAVDAAVQAGVAGLIVDGSVRAPGEGRLIGGPAREPALAQVRHWRERYGKDLFLIGSGGVHEPEDALALRAAGADLVEVDTGVVYTGPGLPKRINDVLLFEAAQTAGPPEPPLRDPERSWFWTALLGAGMMFGSVLALLIAITRVVLPYDEAFVGMSRDQLLALNPRLLAFMAHDRVSLAGTMIAIGAMYFGLSLDGIRRGLHWAQQTVFISAATGFASFFLFLGFGYLDTFHAFVTAILLQFLLLGIHCRLGTWTPTVPPPLRGDRAWRRGLWGQLLLVLHGAGLLGAGLMISAIGVTKVFVPEDLEFMRTTAEALRMANPRLVPLIAHDRATLGGMLLASGWVFLLPALWGFRNGSARLWWTMLIAGTSAYAAALGIHLTVGYTSLMHLLPAFGGLGIFLVGLGLSAGYLRGRAL
ncbi:MAG: dihydroorotate dehydrogenase [Acidobacteriota bacterium]|jgi:dihydroorotate dehydrogenase|nr:dihydroorotate dehydrogenase [Acidobacteriota bacterium]